MASQALKDNCIKLYEHFESQSQDGHWSGSLTTAFSETNIPKGWYSLVMNQLYLSGCALAEQRGNAKQPTVLQLVRHPGDGEWSEISRSDLTKRGRPATLEHRVTDMEKRLGGLNVVDALYDIEQRLQALEKE